MDALNRYIKRRLEVHVEENESVTEGVVKTINKLQDTLRQNCLRAERLRALRRPNTGELSDVSAKIDQFYEQLMGAHVEIAWAAKKPANEPLTGLFTGSLTAQSYLCFLLGR